MAFQRRLVEMYKAHLAEMIELKAGLREGNHSGNTGSTMGAAEQGNQATKRRGQRLRSEGPVAKRAREADLSMFSIATEMKVPYNTVKSWDRRKVPSDHADAFEAAVSRLIKRRLKGQ